jgi:hypothetical protein
MGTGDELEILEEQIRKGEWVEIHMRWCRVKSFEIYNQN